MNGLVKNKKSLALIMIITVAAAAVMGISISSCQKKDAENLITAQKVILGVETSFLTAAVWVARNKGYFQEQGIDLVIKEFDSGKKLWRQCCPERILIWLPWLRNRLCSIALRKMIT